MTFSDRGLAFVVKIQYQIEDRKKHGEHESDDDGTPPTQYGPQEIVLGPRNIFIRQACQKSSSQAKCSPCSNFNRPVWLDS